MIPTNLMFLLLQVAVAVHQIMEVVVQEVEQRVSKEVALVDVRQVHNRQVVHGAMPPIALILEANAVVAVEATMVDIVPHPKIMQVVVALAI